MAATYEPVFRLTLFAPDDTTVLTPAVGAPHADPFQVITVPGVAGWQPFLEAPVGRRGSVDLLRRTTDQGALRCRLLDRRVSGVNLERWGTGFMGDAAQAQRLAGRKGQFDVSLVGPSGPFVTYYTGRVQRASLDADPNVLELLFRDMSRDLPRTCFGRNPAPSASGFRPSVVPIGLIRGHHVYGSFAVSPPLVARVTKATADYAVLEMDDTSKGRHDNVITRGTRALIDQLLPEIDVPGGADGPVPELLRLNLNRTAGGALTGEYKVTAIDEYAVQLERRRRVRKVRVVPLQASDPQRILTSSLVVGNVAEVFLYPGNDAPVDDAHPIMIGDINPVDLIKELLDGLYGLLDAAGTPLQTIAYHAATLDSHRLKWPRVWPASRWRFAGQETRDEVISERIGPAYHLAYRFDPDGLFRTIDVRPPSSSTWSAPATITSADLHRRDGLSWDYGIDGGHNRVVLQYHVDEWFDDDALAAARYTQDPDIPAGRVRPTNGAVHVLGGDPNLRTDPIEVDAAGVRPTRFDVSENQASIPGYVNNLAGVGAELLGPFGRGTITARLPLRRTAANDALIEGDHRVLDVDELPDPGTNRRGGARLALCVEKYDASDHWVATFLDMGESLEAAAPTLGAVTTQVSNPLHGVIVPVTTNGAGDPVALEYVVTDTSVSTRPGEDTPGWTFWRSVPATTNEPIFRLPSGRRVWLRARTLISDGAKTLKRPSAYVFPTNDFVDTDVLPQPGTITPSSITGGSADHDWTNPGGAAGYAIEALLDKATCSAAVLETIDRLAPGSTHYELIGLDVSSTYCFGIRYVDPYGGVSPVRTVQIATGATKPIAPTPAALLLVDV